MNIEKLIDIIPIPNSPGIWNKLWGNIDNTINNTPFKANSSITKPGKT